MANKVLNLTEEQAKTLQTLLLLTAHSDASEERAKKERETLRSIYLMLVQDEARETFVRAAAEGDIIVGADTDVLKSAIAGAQDEVQRTVGDRAYNQHSAIALKAQATADYLREQRRDNGDAAISAEVYDYVTTELADIKRFAIRAHEIASGQYDGLDPDLVSDSLAAIDNANALLRASRPVTEYLAQARARIETMEAGIKAAQDEEQAAALQPDLDALIDEARAEFDRLMEQMQRNISH